MQHRGGPAGFLKVIDDHTLAFADFTRNRQYISVGNLAENNKVCMFLMDYTTRTRIKIWGTAEVVKDDSALLETVTDKHYKGRVERAVRLHVESWDVNCRQHITERFTKSEIEQMMEPLRERIAVLEAELKAIRAPVAQQQPK